MQPTCSSPEFQTKRVGFTNPSIEQNARDCCALASNRTLFGSPVLHIHISMLYTFLFLRFNNHLTVSFESSYSECARVNLAILLHLSNPTMFLCCEFGWNICDLRVAGEQLTLSKVKVVTQWACAEALVVFAKRKIVSSGFGLLFSALLYKLINRLGIYWKRGVTSVMSYDKQ